jgi:hypothetical protein
MAETDPQVQSGRPRPWLLVALAVVAAAYLVMRVLPAKSAGPVAEPSKPRVAATSPVRAVDPAELDVRLEALKQPRPEAQGPGRNPFRFYEKPPPLPLPTKGPPVRPGPPGPPGPVGPPVPEGPPPISLKYFGLMETPAGKIASLSDCRVTMRGREGETIDGRYRLVRIGVESVIMEYLDGRGRTTIRMSGQDCVGK